MAAERLLADIRRLEAYAIDAGCSDRWLGEAISRLVLLALGVQPRRVKALLRVRELVDAGLSVTLACRRTGLSRSRYYELDAELSEISGHHPCDPRAIDLEEPRMARVVKTVNIKDAGDVRPPRDTAGKPPYAPPATPRADGGMSSGNTGGNFDADSLALPVATPADAWDMESKK
jgi:hypothetical protein